MISASLTSNCGSVLNLKALHQVRLKTVLLPDAMDRGRRQPDCLGQSPRAPMGRRLGLAQRRGDYRPLPGRSNLPRTARTRLAPQPLQPFAAIAPPPQTVVWVTPSRVARPRTLSPAALPSTIRALIASAWDMLCARNHCFNATRSAPLTSTQHLFTPMLSRRTGPTFTSETGH